MIIEVSLRFEKELKQLSKKYKKIKDDLRLFKKEILFWGQALNIHFWCMVKLKHHFRVGCCPCCGVVINDYDLRVSIVITNH